MAALAVPGASGEFRWRMMWNDTLPQERQGYQVRCTTPHAIRGLELPTSCAL